MRVNKTAGAVIFSLMLLGLATGTLANGVTFTGALAFDQFTDDRPNVASSGTRLQIGAEGFADLESSRLSFDIDVYNADYLDEGFVDAALILSDENPFRWAVGLLREEWGQPDATRLNMLVSPNLTFGAVTVLDPVAQPGARLSFDLPDRTVLDVVVLSSIRTSPFPQFNERGGFGLPSTRVIEEGNLNKGAAALRLSGASSALDWGLHVFHGLSRAPTFVLSSPTTIDLVHSTYSQLGFELEAAPQDWRVWSEGFWRQNGLNVFGQKVDFGHISLGAEYQYFAAFDGALDVIAGLELRRDTRGLRVDQPFQNGAAFGLTIIQNEFQGWQLDYSYLYDNGNKGQGYILGITKQLSETPAAEFNLSFSRFNAGQLGTVLDAFERDTRISASIEWKY